jgi:hypothetical protein
MEIDNTCRSCLQLSRRHHKFDDNLEDTYYFLTGIKITESDSKICPKCLEKLKTSSEFKKQCQQNDEKYKELLASTGKAAIKQEDPLENIETVMIKEEESLGFQIPDIPESVIDIKEESIETIGKEDPPALEREELIEKYRKYCQFCGKSYSNHHIRRKHEKNVSSV